MNRTEEIQMQTVVGGIVLLILVLVYVSYFHVPVVIYFTLNDEDYSTYRSLKCEFNEIAREQCGKIGDGTLSRIVNERNVILEKYKITHKPRWIAYDVYASR